MKMKFIFLATMIMAVDTVGAQLAPGSFSVQPRLGFTASKMSNVQAVQLGTDATLNSQLIGGLIIGADVEYQLTEPISISSGLNWAMAGCGWEDYETKKDGYTYELVNPRIQTAYLNIPVTASFYIWKGLALRIGVQMGFLTVANLMETVTVSGSKDGINFKTTTDSDESLKSSFNKFDLSIPFGLSYEFKNRIVVDARYNIGMTDLFKNSDPDGKNSRNRTFAITVGYKCRL